MIYLPLARSSPPSDAARFRKSAYAALTFFCKLCHVSKPWERSQSVAKLTKRSVEALSRPATGQTFLWDGELRGFGVRIGSSGQKTFVLQYRTVTGKSRRLKLGRFGVLTVEQARDVARINLGRVAAGEDPADDARDERLSLTVAELCDWYLTEARSGRILGRRNRPIKESTLTSDASRIESHVKPLLGGRAAAGLRIADIEAMQADIAAGKSAKPRGTGRGGTATGGPGVASRTVATLQSILGHAARHDLIAEHPSKGVRRLAGTRRTRRLSVAEIKKLGAAMQYAERNGENPIALATVSFLALTGFRLNEGQQLQRAWLESDGSFVAFPDTKGGAQVRAIGPSAAALVAAQPRLVGSPFVFPAMFGDGPTTAAKACLARLCAMVSIEGVTPHTLRHTFGSVAGDLGFSELTIAALLGHATQSVTQGYVHIDEALKLAVKRVCEEVASLLAEGAAEARGESKPAPHEVSLVSNLSYLRPDAPARPAASLRLYRPAP